MGTLLLPEEFDRERVDEEQIHEEQLVEVEEVGQPPPVQKRFEGANVLLIDEDVASMLSMTPLLESWGIGVHAAGDAEEALEILEEEERIDLILIDIMMPELDSCDTIKKLALMAPGLKMVALTLSLEAVDGRKCLKDALDDVVRKPVDPDELLETLHKYLDT